MFEEFLRLRELLETGGSLDPRSFVDGSHRRLARVLTTGAIDRTPHHGDLVALVAHVLRRHEAISRNQATWLRVPAVNADLGGRTWPSPDDWRSASLVVREEDGRYKLTPRQWSPSWLEGVEGSVLTKPLFAEERRRTYEEVAGDPFLRVLGRVRYRCDAQREAIRAILSVPAGSTIAVNLPTGAGKSLCAQLPALLMSEHGGTSVVVVPTTALALDQARAVKEWLPHDTAYVGGNSGMERERREGIRARVRDGTQRILFTSPESLLQSLRPALYDTARGGLLRLLVVDEAHMVEQWGGEFRSAFQEVAGLRTDLQRHVPAGARPFTTILLTATLTESTLDTLETLFGEPGPLTIVSSAQLRPEPSYWAVRTRDAEEQALIVLDAVRHFPRPLLLYVTEPDQAAQWKTRLSSQGYQRVDIVTGLTPNEQRSSVIERWREADVDIVVATSAFGLGVDQGDVRAVIHATLPENVDRFYQEVGRGGRDGAASASLVVYTTGDEERAASMNRKKIIGIERGQERWSRMFQRRATLAGDRIRVPIDVEPSWRPGDINMSGDLNRAWNVRTLTLMSRALLLTLDSEAPPTFAIDSARADAEAEARERYEQNLEEQRRHRVVSLRHHGTLTDEAWQREVEPARQRTRAADRRSHDLMLESVSGTRCVGDILADAYAVRPRAGARPRAGVNIAVACGGCSYCRYVGRAVYAEPLPAAFPRWPLSTVPGSVLEGLRGDHSAIVIFYDTLTRQQLARFLQWVIAQGVRVAVMPEPELVEWSGSLYQQGTDSQWVFTYPLHGFRYLFAPGLPSLVYLPRGEALPLAIRRELDADTPNRPLRLLMVPIDSPDPLKPHALLRTTVSSRTFTFGEFLTRVGL